MGKRTSDLRAKASLDAAYIVSEVPSNLILKKMHPNRWR